MNLFKSSVIDKIRNQENKSPVNFNKKEKTDDKKNISLKQLIDSNSYNKNFNTPNEALGEIFNLLVKIEKQKQIGILYRVNEEKQRQSIIENRNKELIQALTGRIPKKQEEKPIKDVPSKPSILRVVVPAVAIAAVATVATSKEPTQSKPVQEIRPTIGNEEHVFTGPMNALQENVFTGPMTGIQEQVFTGPMNALQENVFTGPMEPMKDKSEEEKERNLQELRERSKLESERKLREQQEIKKREEEENRLKEENKRKQEEELRKKIERERQETETRIANRRDEESQRNQTMQRVSAPQEIVPSTNRSNQGEIIQTNQQQRQEPPQIVGGDSVRQIYAIGDSHADLGGLSSHQKIINRANGGLASTHPNNYGGKHTIRGTEVGLNTIPPNQIVLISQGANDTANAMKSYLQKMKLYKEGKIKIEPKLPSASIIAQNVAKLVSAAKDRGHIPVFLLFPNGPGRGRLPNHPAIAEYYGGDYQEEVRNAIRTAISSLNVPIVDAQGLDLYDGIHARSYASVARKMVEIARQKEKEISNKSIKTSSISTGTEMQNFNNLFNISGENIYLFSSLENMPKNVIDVNNRTVISQKNTTTPNMNDDIQNIAINDKPPLISKSYEMRDLIVG